MGPTPADQRPLRWRAGTRSADELERQAVTVRNRRWRGDDRRHDRGRAALVMPTRPSPTPVASPPTVSMPAATPLRSTSSQPTEEPPLTEPTDGGTIPAVEAFLADQESVQQSADMRTGAASLAGRTYLYRLIYRCVDFCNGRQGVIEYNLGKRYRQFTATVGVVDDAPDSGQVAVFEVYVDGVRRARQQVSFGNPKSITVDVTGGLRLRLLASEAGIESPAQAGANAAWGVPNHLPNVAWADAQVRQ
jgi:NPCBM/NEW2 domain